MSDFSLKPSFVSSDNKDLLYLVTQALEEISHYQSYVAHPDQTNKEQSHHLESRAWEALGNLACYCGGEIYSLEEIHKSKREVILPEELRSYLRWDKQDQVSHIVKDGQQVPLRSRVNLLARFTHGRRPMHVLFRKNGERYLEAVSLGRLDESSVMFVQSWLKGPQEPMIIDRTKALDESLSLDTNISISKPQLQTELSHQISKPLPKYTDLEVLLDYLEAAPSEMRLKPGYKPLSAMEEYLARVFRGLVYDPTLAKNVIDHYILKTKAGQEWLYRAITENMETTQIVQDMQLLMEQKGITKPQLITHLLVDKKGNLSTQLFWTQLSRALSPGPLPEINTSIEAVVRDMQKDR